MEINGGIRSVLSFGADPLGGPGGPRPRLLSKQIKRSVGKTSTLDTAENSNYGTYPLRKRKEDVCAQENSKASEAVPSDVSILAVGPGGLHCGAVTASGALWLWGSNSYGQCGTEICKIQSPQAILKMPSNTMHVSRISLGQYHTAILTTGGCLFTCGLGSDGQLGQGSEPYYVNGGGNSKFRMVSAFSGLVVHDVCCGWLHTCAIVGKSNQVFSWGDGRRNQLGHVRFTL